MNNNLKAKILVCLSSQREPEPLPVIKIAEEIYRLTGDFVSTSDVKECCSELTIKGYLFKAGGFYKDRPCDLYMTTKEGNVKADEHLSKMDFF